MTEATNLMMDLAEVKLQLRKLGAKYPDCPEKFKAAIADGAEAISRAIVEVPTLFHPQEAVPQ